MPDHPYRLPLTPAQFWDALQKGKGRACEHVRLHGDSGGHGDRLLKAAVTKLTFGNQIDVSRAPWLADLFQATGRPQVYRDATVQALGRTTQPLPCDTQHLRDLALVHAQRGDDHSSEALYQSWSRLGVGWQEILSLDGSPGAARAIQTGPALNAPALDLDVTVIYGRDQLGDSAFRDLLQRQPKTAPLARALLLQFDLQEQERSRPAAREPRPGLHTVLQDIEEGGYYRHTTWLKNASGADVQAVHDRLLAETRRDQLFGLLWLFRVRRTPQLDDRLFELAASDDRELRQVALRALSHWRGPRVRELAWRLADTDESAENVMPILSKNYQPGDGPNLHAWLERLTDPEQIWWVCWELCNLADSEQHPDLDPCLLWGYEATPSAANRSALVKSLLARDALPEQLAEECRHDAAPETRNQFGLAR